jgi:hypothetical protein
MDSNTLVEAMAIYFTYHVLYNILGYRAYKKAVNTVREITDLDLEICHLIYVAFALEIGHVYAARIIFLFETLGISHAYPNRLNLTL